ncbi:MAG TPA: hypothetical protein VFK78_10300 [Gemmatimonadales bacterium]|nr:hypothetical protein [Gemmatimonadales bacterium]
MRFFSLTALALAGVATIAPARTPAGKCPTCFPWISIETPPNPADSEARDAFLLVHVSIRGVPADLPVSGHAEGVVSGARKSVPLAFTRTSKDGVYALRRSWPDGGPWVLVIDVRPGAQATTALVDVSSDGQITAIKVPTREAGGIRYPVAVSSGDVENELSAISHQAPAGN